MLVGSVSPHPLAEQAQACGRLTQVDGPEGPIAPVVTTGYYFCSKKNLDYISRFMHIIFAPVRAILLCIIPIQNHRIVLVIFAQGLAIPLCVVFVRGTAVDGRMVMDKRSSNRAHVRGGSR